MGEVGLGTREIRRLRPPRLPADPTRAIAHQWETERGVRIDERRVFTVFLAGAECPFTCLFCDLWRHTLDGPTPPGALTDQLALALRETADAGVAAGPNDAIKLYNASNFFDARAVPVVDDPALAEMCSPFARVTVESHPRLVGERAERFSEALDGRLEVAMGLETVHPRVFPRLNKGMTLTDFETAVSWARVRGIGTRAFVLVGLPWVEPGEFAGWASRSVRFASDLGVDRVSLIALREGNGALDRIAADGDLHAVTLSHVEEAMAESLSAAGQAIVEVDLWDVERLARCDLCANRRAERLTAANLKQVLGPPVLCDCRT